MWQMSTDEGQEMKKTDIKGGEEKGSGEGTDKWNNVPWYSARCISTKISPTFGKKNSTERNLRAIGV